jgi:hypothetical protein
MKHRMHRIEFLARRREFITLLARADEVIE